MQRPPQPTSRQRIAKAWLVTLVHFDAFRMFPSRYLTATKWRILRKRVRARAQFALLLSQTPRAYQLWTIRNVEAAALQQPAKRIPLLALVQPGYDSAGLSATLQSLAGAKIEHLLLCETGMGSVESIIPKIDFGRNQWFMPVRGGDLVAPEAGAAYSEAIRREGRELNLVYADDDLLDYRGRRSDPHFKPKWNSELQSHYNIMTGACVVRANASDLASAAQNVDWEMALVELAMTRGSPTHVPKVLHHRRSRPSGPMQISPIQVARRLPLVSVIIPIRNRADLLRTCITGLCATDYPAIEIIIADNDSNDAETLAYLGELAQRGITVLPQPGPFNYSRINNNAVAIAKGELICLLNNDIEVLSPDWLKIMASQALRPEVGAVGAQLLYPDGRIQHAGVVIGVGNAAGHAHRLLRPEAEGYFRRHALPQYVSAVTGACLVVRREKFLAAGGLDENNFAVAFNDVDLCLRLNERGWQSFYEPRAVLVHHESVSRGFDTDPIGSARFARELAALRRIWRTHEIVDPFHHPMLSRVTEQFALDLTAGLVVA